MTFRILVDGEEKATVDEQVTRVTVMTSRGAAAVVGISDEGAIDLHIEKAVPGGPIRLDQLEAYQRQANAERVQGLVSGFTPIPVSKELTGTQGVHTYTVTGEEATASDAPHVAPPSRDLAEGLDSSDTATLTARITAYNSSGDADAAIEDNPAGSGTTSSDSDEERSDKDASKEDEFSLS